MVPVASGIDALRMRLEPAPGEASWARCTLVRRRAAAGAWQRVVLSPVARRGRPAVKLVETLDGRETTRMVEAGEWPDTLDALLSEPFDNASLLGPEGDLHVRRTRAGGWQIGRGPASPEPVLPRGHDRTPNHPLPPEAPAVRALLMATGLAGPSGRVLAGGGDKYRQVQHYVELLRGLPGWDEARAQGRRLRILDAGCGKAYLSLALLAYADLSGTPAELVAVDHDADLLARVRACADELGYGDARFEAASICDYANSAPGPVDLLVSLHACDTATDEALAAGVRLGARAIVLAPCCHRELAPQMRGRDAGAEWAVLQRSGLLAGRLADLVTDAIRVAVLEAHGYRAEAIEFVSAEHTSRNLMIRAVRRQGGRALPRAQADLQALVERWQVDPAAVRLLSR
jgi:SAM-dependent methyltransferase